MINKMQALGLWLCFGAMLLVVTSPLADSHEHASNIIVAAIFVLCVGGAFLGVGSPK